MTIVSRNYHGHVVDHLKVVRDSLVAQGKQSLIYLMGDSSLDNKLATCIFNDMLYYFSNQG
jgi:hypothetical protein